MVGDVGGVGEGGVGRGCGGIFSYNDILIFLNVYILHQRGRNYISWPCFDACVSKVYFVSFVTFSSIAPAHLHTTGIVVYPAFLLNNIVTQFHYYTIKGLHDYKSA